MLRCLKDEHQEHTHTHTHTHTHIHVCISHIFVLVNDLSCESSREVVSQTDCLSVLSSRIDSEGMQVLTVAGVRQRMVCNV
jgi:hypothetical protein